MESFEFKEVDEEGLDTLDVVGQADRFNKWMYETIRPHVQGKILEVGSGTGNITKYFLEEKADIYLSDIRDNYCDILKQKFDGLDEGRVIKMDLTDTEFDQKFGEMFGTFDAVYALNVVEHIKDDSLALANIKKLLKNEGQVVILVPAYQTLYNTFDEALEHYRRYTKSRLEKLISENYEVVKSQYFNAIGILGWFLNGNILRKKIIPSGQMKLYNKVIPISRVVDKVILNQMGLSVITIGKKKAN